MASLLAAGAAAVLYGCLVRLVMGVATSTAEAGVCLVLVAVACAALGAAPTPARLAAVGLGGLACALAISRHKMSSR